MTISTAALALVVGAALPAAAQPTTLDWGGAMPKEGHPFNVRSGPGTNYSLIETVYSGYRRCAVDDCGETRVGTSYTCWTGGPAGNIWLPVVTANSTTGWVAQKCVALGRVA
ncbi:hypothetical protein ACFVUW_11010 [Streptomyces xiamenensis]|uniref:hypothetical protein n=1 Tax=Streptomyces xiamenensis TaxID=408015 RepID=UPI0036EF9ED5